MPTDAAVVIPIPAANTLIPPLYVLFSEKIVLVEIVKAVFADVETMPIILCAAGVVPGFTVAVIRSLMVLPVIEDLTEPV